MNNNLLESLLHEKESSALDFKSEQYPFASATDEIKSELLKDILAFANAWRRSDAYILIGVKQSSIGRSSVVGISEQLKDESLQQFVNKKIHRPVLFSYEAYPYENKQIGIIHIPLQERFFYLKKDFGKLRSNIIYLRSGSSTDSIPLDEMLRLDLLKQDGINTQTELNILLEEIEDFFDKYSNINVYEKRTRFKSQQYQRLFDSGIINKLEKELRIAIQNAYDEIKEINRLINAGWDMPPRSAVWAESNNEARSLLPNAKNKANIAFKLLKEYLELFN